MWLAFHNPSHGPGLETVSGARVGSVELVGSECGHVGGLGGSQRSNHGWFGGMSQGGQCTRP